MPIDVSSAFGWSVIRVRSISQVAVSTARARGRGRGVYRRYEKYSFCLLCSALSCLARQRRPFRPVKTKDPPQVVALRVSIRQE